MKFLAALGVWAIALSAGTPPGIAASASVKAGAWHEAGTFPVGRHPTDLAFDATGTVWVANFGDGTVTRLSREGARLGVYPAGPKPRKLAVGADGHLWVANWGANTVTRLSPEGRFVGRYPVGELPNSLAVDGTGHVWVGNMGSHTVMRLSPGGEVAGSFRFDRPSSLAVDPSSDAVWVTSLTAGKNNLVRLGPDCQPTAAFTVPSMPERVSVDGQGRVWVSHMVGPAARKISLLSVETQRQTGLWTGFKNQAVTVDAVGNGWVANTEYVIDGEHGYLASNPLTNTVTCVSPGGRILGTYTAGPDAWAVKISGQGEPWVVNHLAGSVTRLSL